MTRRTQITVEDGDTVELVNVSGIGGGVTLLIGEHIALHVESQGTPLSRPGSGQSAPAEEAAPSPSTDLDSVGPWQVDAEPGGQRYGNDFIENTVTGKVYEGDGELATVLNTLESRVKQLEAKVQPSPSSECCCDKTHFHEESDGSYVGIREGTGAICPHCPVHISKPSEDKLTPVIPVHIHLEPSEEVRDDRGTV